jgi:hypothetical protein
VFSSTDVVGLATLVLVVAVVATAGVVVLGVVVVVVVVVEAELIGSLAQAGGGRSLEFVVEVESGVLLTIGGFVGVVVDDIVVELPFVVVAIDVAGFNVTLLDDVDLTKDGEVFVDDVLGTKLTGVEVFVSTFFTMGGAIGVVVITADAGGIGIVVLFPLRPPPDD